MYTLPPKKTFALFETPPNRKLIAKLKNNGSNVILFPPIETEKVDLSANSEAFLHKLSEFEWIIFPDVYTVEFFLQNLEELEIDLFELDSLKVCVFGEAIADKLRFSQLHVDLIADQASDKAVFQALSNYLTELIHDVKFLLIKEVSRDYALKNLLINSGAEISEAALYAAKIPCGSGIVKLKTLLKGGAIDEFIFSADEDLEGLKHYFDGESLAELLTDIKISAVSQNIFQTLKETNLPARFFVLKGK